MRKYVELPARDLQPGDTFSLHRRQNSKLFVIYTQTQVRKPIIWMSKTLLVLIEQPRCSPNEFYSLTAKFTAS